MSKRKSNYKTGRKSSKSKPYREQVPPSLRFDVFTRDGFKCRYCGKGSPEVKLQADHFIPVSKGGPTHIDNLVTACFGCNSGKKAKLLPGVETSKLPELVKDGRINIDPRELLPEIEKRAVAANAKQVENDESVIELARAWCITAGRRSVDLGTIRFLASYCRPAYSIEKIMYWLEIALRKLGRHADDDPLGRYVCGIKRNHEEQLLSGCPFGTCGECVNCKAAGVAGPPPLPKQRYHGEVTVTPEREMKTSREDHPDIEF